MGGTYFVPDAGGNAEIAGTVDKARFYRILSGILSS